jgi:hypothetical protein
MRFQPQRTRRDSRINPRVRPPRGFIAAAVELAMSARHGATTLCCLAGSFADRRHLNVASRA